MRLYALTEPHDPEAIELFITEVDAQRVLETAQGRGRIWRGLLPREEMELADADFSSSGRTEPPVRPTHRIV